MKTLLLALLTGLLFASCGTEKQGNVYNVIEACDNDGCRTVDYNIELNRATTDTISWTSITSLAEGNKVVFRAVKVK